MYLYGTVMDPLYIYNIGFAVGYKYLITYLKDKVPYKVRAT